MFFGCSYTFGEGLNDNEIAPNILQKELGNNYRIYNFSYSGYGPHQMLRAIETGLIDSIIEFEPELIIFETLPDHLHRILDYKYWGRHDPKYIKDTDSNIVEFVGNFDKTNSKFCNSELFRKIMKKFENKK